MKFIEEICTKIVSPQKIRYSAYDLGSVYLGSGKRCDFQVTNSRGHKMPVSFYQCNQKKIEGVCVIYLHSMNGSRLESSIYAQSILKLGISFCNFDFSGCGNSQGDSISFGANEKHDISAVIEKLKEKFKIKKFILWGRSMGAVSAVKYYQLAREDQWSNLKYQIIGLVLDSCFKSFSQLAIEIGHKYSNVPQFLIKAGYFFIKNTLQEKGKFKLSQLQLEQVVSSFQIPVLFLASQTDVTVDCHHSKDLFQSYGYFKKELYFINGLHNQSRDEDYFKKIKQFVQTQIALQIIQNNNKPKNKEPGFAYLQKMMINQHNYRFEKDDIPQQTCYCSLFNNKTAKTSIDTNVDPIQLVSTNRNLSEQIIRHKPRPVNSYPRMVKSADNLTKITQY